MGAQVRANTVLPAQATAFVCCCIQKVPVNEGATVAEWAEDKYTSTKGRGTHVNLPPVGILSCAPKVTVSRLCEGFSVPAGTEKT